MNKKETTIINSVAAFCACVLIIAAVCAFMPVNGEQKIYDDMIRLHVLANSNSQEDQDLKFEVRDYILADIAELTKDCTDSSEAAEKIQMGLQDIEIKAREFIKSKGYHYEISAALSREIYPQRTYADIEGDYIFPAGEYNSLRIKIGEAKGENWWCVLFPPLCLSGSKIEEELAVAGYSDEQINILKKNKSIKYEIRFKILEFFKNT